MKVLLISDNIIVLNRVRQVLQTLSKDVSEKYFFSFGYSTGNSEFELRFGNSEWIQAVNVSKEINSIVEKYQLVLSLHCKQIFPYELVRNVRCINVHPGLNPYNRGWFPHVFSLMNGLASGVTIHEMDTQIDHGPIICQKEVPTFSWDTSLTLYERIIDEEIELLTTNFISILENDYQTSIPENGNLNSKSDYAELCLIDLDEKDTFRHHINRLRSLSHGDKENAYFIDEDGNKIFVSIGLSKK